MSLQIFSFKHYVILLVGILTVALWAWQTNLNIPAPDVTFKTITGKKIELAKLQGKPVLISFWATDCKMCVKEIPYLIELYNQYHPLGLETIAVAMYYDPPSHVVAMTKAKQIPYDVALDLKSTVANAFGKVQLVPTTILISPEGKIVMQKTGEFDMKDIQQRLEKLIGSMQKAPTPKIV